MKRKSTDIDVGDDEVTEKGLMKSGKWERHKWTSFHDVHLFEKALECQAVTKTFGSILRRWQDVSRMLSEENIFMDWGELKVDMLRRRYEKIYNDEIKELRNAGHDLHMENDQMSDLQKLVIKAKAAIDENEEEKQRKKDKDKPRMRNSDESAKVVIKETVERFLSRNSAVGLGESFDLSKAATETIDHLNALKVLQQVEPDLEAKGAVVVKIIESQSQQIQYLTKQNSMLLNLVINLFEKHIS